MTNDNRSCEVEIVRTSIGESRYVTIAGPVSNVIGMLGEASGDVAEATINTVQSAANLPSTRASTCVFVLGAIIDISATVHHERLHDGADVFVQTKCYPDLGGKP